jgi:putative NIF3 family GTP cyclohydrolase 1 type 2
LSRLRHLCDGRPEVRHFLWAKEVGLNLIDADHFCTENVVVPHLAASSGRAFRRSASGFPRCTPQTVRFF